MCNQYAYAEREREREREKTPYPGHLTSLDLDSPRLPTRTPHLSVIQPVRSMPEKRSQGRQALHAVFGTTPPPTNPAREDPREPETRQRAEGRGQSSPTCHDTCTLPPGSHGRPGARMVLCRSALH
ncbi:hypothetical protein PZA11_003411 [Diplocarpon coronariae]